MQRFVTERAHKASDQERPITDEEFKKNPGEERTTYQPVLKLVEQ
jgi:hypothetical protein